MVTDAPPRAAVRRRQYDASDSLTHLPAPDPGPLREATRAFEAALATGKSPAVMAAGERLLQVLSAHYRVAPPPLRVLGVRPHRVIEGQLAYELFGDYSPDTQRIRIWTRTARLGRVTSFRGLLSTLLHEFCHHLDVRGLGFSATPHTRGFFHRIDALYHMALDTPAEKRRPLVWIPSGRVFRIDWRRFRAQGGMPPTIENHDRS